MKLLTKEEEAAHWRATLEGGVVGGMAGLAIGAVGVYAASKRYHFFRQLTLPLKAFLVTSSGTFAGIISADHASRGFETAANPKAVEYEEMERQKKLAEYGSMSWTERAMAFGKRERYKIVGASWLASMVVAFSLVNRNKFLTGQQKLVQARVYAQFLTLGVLVASAAFEISDSKNEEGRWETVKYVDPNDPSGKKMLERRQEIQHSDGDTLWKDMVAAEEERLKERDEAEKRIHKETNRKGASANKDSHESAGGKKQTKGKDATEEANSGKGAKNDPEKETRKNSSKDSSKNDDKKEKDMEDKKDEKKEKEKK